MSNDLYTKVALTIIALALSVIAGNQLLNSAQAQAGPDCGFADRPDCRVYVTNWPSRLPPPVLIPIPEQTRPPVNR